MEWLDVAAGGIPIRGVGGSPLTGILFLRDGRPDMMGIDENFWARDCGCLFSDGIERMKWFADGFFSLWAPTL
jgi:hypothetical protein